jgi:radical SAM protein with 4Fe4S-binding SPASM domain
VSNPVLKNVGGLGKGASYRYHRARRRCMAPSFLIHQVTVRCNSRCAMCSIWKLEPGDELGLEEVDGLLQDPFMASLRWVNLTGGEPFLRKDLPELIGAYGRRCPELEIVAIPTNGFLPDRIEEGVERALEALAGTGALLSVTVSIDALGADHDAIRGVPGCFDLAMETLDRLRYIDHPRFTTGVETVITHINVGQIEDIYRALKERAPHVNMTPAMAADFFGNKGSFDPVALRGDDVQRMLDFLSSIAKEEPAYAYYFDKVRDIHLKGRRTYPCLGCYSTMMLSPTGDVYPCLMLGGDGWRLGNVREGAIRDIWCSARADGMRARISKNPSCELCTNNCDIMANLKAETWNFATWMALHPGTFLALLRYVRENEFAKKVA